MTLLGNLYEARPMVYQHYILTKSIMDKNNSKYIHKEEIRHLKCIHKN